MSKQHDLWCSNIVSEIAKLLEARNVMVDDAKRILRTVLEHADDHTGFMPFRTNLRNFVMTGQIGGVEQASAPPPEEKSTSLPDAEPSNGRQ